MLPSGYGQRVGARRPRVLRPGAAIRLTELQASVRHDLELRVTGASVVEREAEVDRCGDGVVADRVAEARALRRIAPRGAAVCPVGSIQA